MGGVDRFLFERFGNDGLDPIVANLPRRAAPRLIVKAVQTPLRKTLPPHTNRLSRCANSSGNLAIVLACCCAEDDFCALGQGTPSLAAASFSSGDSLISHA